MALGQVGDEVVRILRPVAFAVLGTALPVVSGGLLGYYLGPWGALVSFPLGALEGGLLFWWLLRKRRRVLGQK